MKLIKKICNIIDFTIFIVPLGILICVIVGPFYIIISLYKDMFKELTLNDKIEINDVTYFYYMQIITNLTLTIILKSMTNLLRVSK